jgi:ADP-dependent NAD(P)H-hydrate dehydratase / NAD(P)H-hydrate epimerase
MSNPHIPTITQKQVSSFLPPRPQNSHKGQFGTVAVIGGNKGMVGAALLAARAALKLGAGCVHAGLLADNAPSVDMQQPELMLAAAEATLKLPKLDVLTIGCGMGHDLRAQKILHDALKLNVTLVLDADALNILVSRPDLRSPLLSRKAASVMTPHPGEAARLLGISIEEVQTARTDVTLELASRFNCSVVLKGSGSLCVTRERKTWLNKTGNPGMSGPGMGDVLGGMIAAFIAQGLSVDDAMLLAVHLHGAAADALAQQQASIGMTASEVTEWSRWLLNQWIK